MKKELYNSPQVRTLTVNVSSVLMQSVTRNASGADVTMDTESDFDSFFGS